MALTMEAYLKLVLTDVQQDDGVDDTGIIENTVNALHRANIRDMFGRWWDNPTSRDSLDPCMPIPSRRLLDLVCAGCAS